MSGNITRNSPVTRDDAGNRRITVPVGVGSCQTAAERARIRDMFAALSLCAVYAMPTVAKTQWVFAGALNSADTQNTFGSTIDILGQSSPAGVDAVYTTDGLENGQFQTYVLACAIGMHLEVSPFMCLIRGNAFTRAVTPPITKPFSPDEWTVNDAVLTTGAWGAGVIPPVSRAYLMYGQPFALACWAMVRAYNLLWTYGSGINILNDQLRETAFMPTNAQEGSASNSEIDALRLAREVNNRYGSPAIKSATNFVLTDTTRTGSVGAAPNIGTFAPNADLQYVGVTYGGEDLRSKVGIGQNSELRTLTNSMVIRPGVPIGMKLVQRDSILGNYMRAQIDATQGFGGTPPAAFDEATDYNNAVAGSAFTERTIDGLNVAQTLITGSQVFKGGYLLMSNIVKGWEIGEDMATLIRGNTELTNELCAECGVMVAWQK